MLHIPKEFVDYKIMDKFSEDLIKRVNAEYDELVKLRRYFHAHPETAWEEYETTGYITEYLTALGLEVFGFEGHSGCYCYIQGTKTPTSNKTILLRADIDALPIDEETGLAYSSENPGKFHGCGHDTHIAMLLVACKILCDIKEQIPGRVKVLFQGAEETAIGSVYYVSQGIMDDVDAVYGCHTVTWCDDMTISVCPGPRMSSTDMFHINVQGKGCHGGMPHLGNDAIVCASAIVQNLQSIVSRTVNPIDSMVITVGMLHSGTAYNVIADTASMSGTVRTFKNELRKHAEDKIKQIAENTALAYGCTASVDYQYKTGAVIHSNDKMNKIAKNAALKLFKEEQIIDSPPVGGGDDFSSFMEKAPGIYAFIGAAIPNEENIIYGHHHPKVIFDENAMKMGTAMHVQMVMDVLSEF